MHAYWLAVSRVSRTVARLMDPEAGAPKLGGLGRAGFNMLDLGVPQGRAPRPPEKAGWVGLGYEQTKTETVNIKVKSATITFLQTCLLVHSM